MAFQNFYIAASGGSNLNAGTAQTGAADYTSLAGNWDGTSIFTPTDGSNPSTKIAVGDYVSLYLNADTAVRYLSKATAVTNAVNGTVTLDTTATVKYGTAPALQTGTANIKHSGAWADLGLCVANGILNTGTIPASTKVNVQSGTYANTTTSRTCGLAGTAILTLWIDGYQTSPGDLDNVTPTAARVAGTTMPNFTFTTGIMTLGNFQIWSNLAFTGTSTTNVVATGQNDYLDRVQVNDTSTGNAINFGASGGTTAFACYFKSASTTNACVNMSASPGGNLYDCVLTGGNNGISATSLTGIRVVGCKIINFTAAGVLFTTGNGEFERCTISGVGGSGVDGIKWSGVPTGRPVVKDCVFDTLTNGVNNGGGSNTQIINTRNNDFNAVTNHYVGFGDVYQPGDQTESASPFNNAAGGDYTLAGAALARKNASPGQFEGEAFNSYLSIGAYDPQSGGIAGQAKVVGQGVCW